MFFNHINNSRLQESIIQIEGGNPVAFLGVNNIHFQILKSYFSKLKIVARGNDIIAKGSSADLKQFNEKMSLLLGHYYKNHHITESNFNLLLNEAGPDKELISSKDDVLVYGNGGTQIKARTINQKRIVTSSEENDLIFAVGPAGTGKTYTAVALAVRALKNKEVRRIILTRPAVEAGENLGFLPGDLKEKLDPYLQPLYDALRDMIPAERLDSFLEKGTIQIAPLAFMRGRTLDNAFVILDEAQNATEGQMKMFLTRMGQSAKFIITGDETQVDLPRNQKSGLVQAVKLLKNIKGIDIIVLDERDVIRHRLVKEIIFAYNKPDTNNFISKSEEKK